MYKEINKKNLIKSILFALLVFVGVLLQTFSYATLRVRADAPMSLDNTAIEDDLRDIDVKLYPQDSTGKVRLLRFQEYCYSESSFLSDMYGLYLYIYNPTEKAIDITKDVNTANMAISYKEDGKPSEYANVGLTYLDSTSNSRFYKFKVTDGESFLTLANDYKQKFGVRRYDVTGVQVLYKDSTSTDAEDSPVAKTLTYTGYAAGCGDNTAAESTLVCNVLELETIELNVGHTNYRFGDKGATSLLYDIQDDLNAVYFSVPQKFFDDYGGLQKISAEWYEYKTTPCFVTSDADAYNALKNYIGVDIGEGNADIGYRILWEYNYKPSMANDMTTDWYFYQHYNGSAQQDTGYNVEHFEGNATTRIDWLFNKTVKETDDWKISRAEVEQYMKDYTASHSSQGIIRGYAENLFIDTIDEDRQSLLTNYDAGAKNGHISVTIDIGDEGTLETAPDSFWNKLWNGWHKEEVNYNPIVIVPNEDADLEKTEFCKKYYVNDKDYDATMTAFKNAKENGEQFVLFRFAVTDYYSATAKFDTTTDRGLLAGLSADNGYVAQETVFLDFDIISLTFRKDGVDTVIGAVSDPFDIINGLDQPDELGVPKDDRWLLILGLLVLLVIGVYIWPFISPFITFIISLTLGGVKIIFKIALSIVLFPIRLILGLFRRR